MSSIDGKAVEVITRVVGRHGRTSIPAAKRLDAAHTLSGLQCACGDDIWTPDHAAERVWAALIDELGMREESEFDVRPQGREVGWQFESQAEADQQIRGVRAAYANQPEQLAALDPIDVHASTRLVSDWTPTTEETR